ncbi:hypothetical protein [Eubacterium callanderi]|uniref:hypothetical protein n=1 Tax=Eubacterium callanderi TaxID=53442 RepID=UPI00399972A5
MEQKKLYIDEHNNCVLLSRDEEDLPVSAFRRNTYAECFQECDHFYKHIPTLEDCNDDLRQMAEKQEK